MDFFPSRSERREVDARSGGVKMGAVSTGTSISRCVLGFEISLMT